MSWHLGGWGRRINTSRAAWPIQSVSRAQASLNYTEILSQSKVRCILALCRLRWPRDSDPRDQNGSSKVKCPRAEVKSHRIFVASKKKKISSRTKLSIDSHTVYLCLSFLCTIPCLSVSLCDSLSLSSHILLNNTFKTETFNSLSLNFEPQKKIEKSWTFLWSEDPTILVN